MPRVLISDKLSDRAVEIFRDRGIDVDFQPDLGKDKARLEAVIGDYDGLAIRSATKVTEKVLEAAPNLKVVGRAGIGVDNIDIKAATARGVVVMNTPFGNSTTTAEHTVAMMFALARQIPQANTSTHAGNWEKSRFMGVELTGKVLGLIGCGNIGTIVASRACGLKMRVIAYDPFLGAERAQELGVEKVELDDLLARADIITLHTPLTDQTRNILSRENLLKTRPGVRVINCARGGLVDEAALKELLDAGHVAGAALDVFTTEPPPADFPLYGMENVVLTPHLGASTAEAQETVALQVAEQMADYLITGAVSNAINMPSITAEEAPIIKPYVKLAELLGSFAGQVTEGPIREVEILYEGNIAAMNTKPMTAALIAGLLKPLVSDVNMVSAPVLLKDRGIKLAETKRDKAGVYDGYIRLTIETERQKRSVAGTVFSDGRPRFIQIKGINLDAAPAPHMLYTTNDDKPGIIGALGHAFGDAGVNIANFTLGRDHAGGQAIALLHLDDRIPDDLLKLVRTLPNIGQAKALEFDV